MSENKVTGLKTWVAGNPSRYQLHDITHFPDWHNVIVWDAFLNNLAAAFMIVACLAWMAGGSVYSALLPYALTLAVVILIADLCLLIIDLGDSWRFWHAMRVLHFTSPLSVGVWSLACFGIFLGLALAVFWLSVIFSPEGGFSLPALTLASTVMRVFTVMAFIGAVVVMCYKGVAFSCTSQPGVKDMRWLTTYMVCDSFQMGTGLYILMCCFLEFVVSERIIAYEAIRGLVIPMAIFAVAHVVSFGLLFSEVKERRDKMYQQFNIWVNILVWLFCGVVAICLLFFGVWGAAIASLIVICSGLIERYWIVGLTHPI